MASSPSSRRRRMEPPSPGPAAGPAARDWASLPHDVLSAVLLKLGPCRNIMRGAEFVCAAWRRAAVEDPDLWRRVDIDVGALESAGLRKGWGAMVRAAVDRGAGRCEAFSGPCDEELLLHLVERANSLKSLHVLCLDITDEVLNVAVKKHPLLEHLELTYVSITGGNMFKYVCQACPHLKKLKLSFCSSLDDDSDEGVLELEVIKGGFPMMCKLLSLELYECYLTTEGLMAILDNCPVLESLHITGLSDHYQIDKEVRAKCARVKNLTIPEGFNLCMGFG